MLREKIIQSIDESIGVKGLLRESQLKQIELVAKAMIATIKNGHKILVFGNGGSAADSMHIAAELVGRFKKERKAIPAIALGTNVSVLTSLSNDYRFEYAFEREIEALGRHGDMALGISTSGRSKNVIRGIVKASKMGLKTAALTGREGPISKVADITIKVPSKSTPRIQEAHILIGHILCEIVEDALS